MVVTHFGTDFTPLSTRMANLHSCINMERHACWWTLFHKCEFIEICIVWGVKPTGEDAGCFAPLLWSRMKELNKYSLMPLVWWTRWWALQKSAPSLQKCTKQNINQCDQFGWCPIFGICAVSDCSILKLQGQSCVFMIIWAHLVQLGSPAGHPRHTSCL